MVISERNLRIKQRRISALMCYRSGNVGHTRAIDPAGL